ncbi:MAG: hypothetical protein ACXVFV_00410, partial [Mycobacteriales bacterium]
MNRTTTRVGAAAALLLGLLTTTSTRAPAASATTTPPTKVLVVVEENHTQTQALNGMPYLRSLSSTYGRTSSYHGVTHPSLPNYLAIAGGSTFGVHDDYPPSYHKLTGASVFGQALAHARTAKTYAEAMSSACQQYAYGRYAVKHNPWA